MSQSLNNIGAASKTSLSSALKLSKTIENLAFSINNAGAFAVSFQSKIAGVGAEARNLSGAFSGVQKGANFVGNAVRNMIAPVVASESAIKNIGLALNQGANASTGFANAASRFTSAAQLMNIPKLGDDVSRLTKTIDNSAQALIKKSAAADKVGKSFVNIGGAVSKTLGPLAAFASFITRIAVFSVAAGLVVRGFFAITQAISNAVSTGLNFNKTLEQGQIAIAALLVSGRDLRNTMGATVEPVTAYGLQLSRASNLQQELLVRSITTLGTYQELAEVFQTVLAFTKNQTTTDQERLTLAQGILNAGKLLGLNQSLLAVEARQILTLENQKGQQILSSLGITVKQLREFQKQGTLVQELNKLLSTYNIISGKIALTWEGLVSSIKTFFSFLAGQSFEQTFEAMRQILIGIVEEFKEINKRADFVGVIGLDNEALKELGASFARIAAPTTQWLADFVNGLINILDKLRLLKDAMDDLMAGAAGAGGLFGGQAPPPIDEKVFDSFDELSEHVKNLGGLLDILKKDFDSLNENQLNALARGMVILSGSFSKAETDIRVFAREHPEAADSAEILLSTLNRLRAELDAQTGSLEKVKKGHEESSKAVDKVAKAMASARQSLIEHTASLRIENEELAKAVAGFITLEVALGNAEERQNALKSGSAELAKAYREAKGTNDEYRKSIEEANKALENHIKAVDGIIKAHIQSTEAILDDTEAIVKENQELLDENKILTAAIEGRIELEEVEKALTKARIDRTIATEEAKLAEQGLSDAEKAAMRLKIESLKGTRDLTQANQELKQVLDKQAVTIPTIAGMFFHAIDNVIAGLAAGTLKIKNALRSLGAAMVGEFIRGFAEIIRRKILFEQKFVNNVQALGGLLKNAVNFATSGFGAALTAKLFGAETEEQIGAGAGAFAGRLAGIILTPILGPLAPLIGGALGGILGGFFGGLFVNLPTKGTQIRQAVVKWLEDIDVSFASQIKSGKYFFKTTTALADELGIGFLEASKIVLEDKAGPEIARQLQALGAFITADFAKEIGKPLEQTATTFGNMLIANLGIEAIPDAMAEIIEKSGITFEAVIESLNKEFDKGRINVEFYNDAIQGAIDLFLTDLPESIDAAKIAMRSFTDDGIFSLELFQENLEATIEAIRKSEEALEKAREQAEQFTSALAGVGSSLSQDIANALLQTGSFDTGSLTATLQQQVAQAVIQGIIEGIVQTAIIQPIIEVALKPFRDAMAGMLVDGVLASLEISSLLVIGAEAIADIPAAIATGVALLEQLFNDPDFQAMLDSIETVSNAAVVTGAGQGGAPQPSPPGSTANPEPVPLEDLQATFDEFVNAANAFQDAVEDTADPLGDLVEQMIELTAAAEAALETGLDDIQIMNELDESHEAFVEGLRDEIQALGSYDTLFGDLQDTLDEFRLAQEALRLAFDEGELTLEEWTSLLKEFAVVAVKELITQFRALTDTILDMVEETQDAIESVQDFIDAGEDLSSLESDLADLTDDYEQALKDLRKEMIGVILSGESMGQMLDDLDESFKVQAEAIIDDFINEITSPAKELLEGVGDSFVDLQLEANRLTDIALSGFESMTDNTEQVLADIDSAIEAQIDFIDAIRELQAAFEDFIDSINSDIRNLILEGMSLENQLSFVGQEIGSLFSDFATQAASGQFDKALETGEEIRGLILQQFDIQKQLQQQILDDKIAELEATRDANIAKLEATRNANILAIENEKEARREQLRFTIDFLDEQIKLQEDTNNESLRQQEDAAQEQLRLQEETLQEQLKIIEDFRNAAEGIRRAIDQILLSEVSPLTPQARLDEARRQFEEAVSLARGGDIEAAGRVGQLAQQFLGEASSFFASSAPFQAIFGEVINTLEELGVQFEQDAQLVQLEIISETLGNVEGAIFKDTAELIITRDILQKELDNIDDTFQAQTDEQNRIFEDATDEQNRIFEDAVAEQTTAFEAAIADARFQTIAQLEALRTGADFSIANLQGLEAASLLKLSDLVTAAEDIGDILKNDVISAIDNPHWVQTIVDVLNNIASRVNAPIISPPPRREDTLFSPPPPIGSFSLVGQSTPLPGYFLPPGVNVNEPGTFPAVYNALGPFLPLQHGGIVTRPTPAFLHQGEAVIPLARSRDQIEVGIDYNAMKSVFVEALSETRGNTVVNVPIEVITEDGEVLAKRVIQRLANDSSSGKIVIHSGGVGNLKRF